jgi:hypothetical protein
MKEVNVYGGGAVLLSISARLGLRPCGLGMFLGMETVKGAGCAWQSAVAMVDCRPSKSTGDCCVGELEAVDDVFIDRAWPGFRVTMTLFQNCL